MFNVDNIVIVGAGVLGVSVDSELSLQGRNGDLFLVGTRVDENALG